MDNSLNIAFEKPIITPFYRGYTILDKYQNETHSYFIALVYDSQSSSSLNLFKVNLFDSNLELKRESIIINGSNFFTGKFISDSGDSIIIQVEGYIEKTHGDSINKQIKYLIYNTSNGTFNDYEISANDINASMQGKAEVLDPNILVLFNEKEIDKNIIANYYNNEFGILILNVNYSEVATLPPFSYTNDKDANTIIIARYKNSQTPSLIINSFSGDAAMVGGDQINLYKSENQKSITIHYSAFNLPNDIANIQVCLSPDSNFKKIIKVNMLSINQDSICFELLNEIPDGKYLLRLENKKILSSPVIVQIKNDYRDNYIKTKQITWANAVLLLGLFFVFIWLALITFIPSLVEYKFNIFKILLRNQDYNTLWQWGISLIVLTPLLGLMTFILKSINQCIKFING